MPSTSSESQSQCDATSTTSTEQTTSTTSSDSNPNHFQSFDETLANYEQELHKRVCFNQITAVRNTFYAITGHHDNKSRKEYVVKPRAALLCALSTKYTLTDVANAFDIHHATVIHHRKHHEGNLSAWKGYKEIFDKAIQTLHSMPFIKSTSLPDNPPKSFNEWQEHLLEQRRQIFERNVGMVNITDEMSSQQDMVDKAKLLDRMLKEIREGADLNSAAQRVLNDAINYGFTK